MQALCGEYCREPLIPEYEGQAERGTQAFAFLLYAHSLLMEVTIETDRQTDYQSIRLLLSDETLQHSAVLLP